MKKMILLFLIISTTHTFAQSAIQKLYAQKRYAEVVAFADKTENLSGQDIFVIGQSFLMQKDDINAIKMFENAIAKGYKDGEVYYAKGLAEVNQKRYSAATASFRQALFLMPGRKKVMIALANTYYDTNNLDSALVLNERIAENWGDYYPAIYMYCHILFEQEKPAASLAAYYQRLYILKKDNILYQQGLQDVVRMEWHSMKNYYKAEAAIKNLMAAAPQNYGYNMMLMQLYNFTGKYAEAAAQETYILEGYKTSKLSNDYYTKGAMVLEQFDTTDLHIEAYRYFQPEKKENCWYAAFIFSQDANRPLGKITLCETGTNYTLTGFRELPNVVLEKPISYEIFKVALLQYLLAPSPTVPTVVPDSTQIKD